MISVSGVKELQQVLGPIRAENKTIGFVATMGALHEGHQSLMKQAKQTCDILIVSIFVNPLQFGPNEDFDSYPRQLEQDKKIAESAGCDVLFHPTELDLYPDGATQTIHVNQGASVLCGKSRPGHFDGVATVVLKLLSIVRPHKAFFGQKDAQQLAILKQLSKEFFLPVQIIGCPTVREKDGLAKSSRNMRLTRNERELAPKFYQALQEAAELSVNNVNELIAYVTTELQRIPVGEIDYVEAYEYPSLKPIQQPVGTVILALAYHFSDARLIDHILINYNRGDA